MGYKIRGVYEQYMGVAFRKTDQLFMLLVLFFGIIIFMIQLDCLIYAVLTLVIPAKLTYHSLKSEQHQQHLSLWGHYWAFYFLFCTLQCWMPFLTYQPIKLVILLVHIWLYAEQYRGALFLSDLIKQKIKEFGVDEYIKLVAEQTKFLKLFEEDFTSPRQVNVKSE